MKEKEEIENEKSSTTIMTGIAYFLLFCVVIVLVVFLAVQFRGNLRSNDVQVNYKNIEKTLQKKGYPPSLIDKIMELNPEKQDAFMNAKQTLNLTSQQNQKGPSLFSDYRQIYKQQRQKSLKFKEQNREK